MIACHPESKYMYVYRYLITIVSISVFLIVLSSCSDPNQSPNEVLEDTTHLTVYKKTQCSCCGKWISHIRGNGFTTTSKNQHDLTDIKEKLGIEKSLRSCHTSVTDDGFVFEGHIPAKFVRQFLKDKPQGSKGLAVPGMPTGTPGMEFGDLFRPYTIYLLKVDGSVEIYAKVNSSEEQI